MNFVSADQPYIVKVEYSGGKKPEMFDNHGRGFPPDVGPKYLELGDVPITVRYSDYGKMFEGCLTVIISYAEDAATFTIETIDGRLSSKPIQLGGRDGADVGVFRVFTLPEHQAKSPSGK